MLPHHVNSWTIPVDLGIVSRESAKIPKTGTTVVQIDPFPELFYTIKTPNHPTYHWSTLCPLEVWVRGLYNSWWFCVHKLSMFIYLSMGYPTRANSSPFWTWQVCISFYKVWLNPVNWNIHYARTDLLIVVYFDSILQKYLNKE